MKRMFALVLTLVLVLSCAGCSDKTAHTVESFRSVMEEAGFEVVDVTKDTDTNGIDVTILVAMKDDYQIDFYQFTSEDTAKSVYAHNQSNTEEMSSSYHISVSLFDFAKHEQVSDSTHYYMAWVGNTMIYCANDSAYRDQIMEAVKALGYE